MIDLEPIRRDTTRRSSARGTSTSHYPLGRWTVDFTNEYGRQIHVAVTNRHPDAVRIEMVGPNSTSTNRITRIEAKALRNALNAALGEGEETDLQALARLSPLPLVEENHG